MENTLLKIFIIIAPLSGVAVAITSTLSKIVLHKNGVSVTFLNPTIKDYVEMKKLAFNNSKYKLLYYGLLYSTISFFTMLALFVTMILFSLYG